MYNNPYFNGMKEPQQPIQNIFTNQMPNSTFMARFLKDGETPQEVFVNSKTALISLKEKKLHIKELDGSIKTYDLVVPLDEKDKKIMALESQINELKEMMSNVSTVPTIQEPITTVDEDTGSDTSIKKHGRK